MTQARPDLAAWLVASRPEIDRVLAARLGAAAPHPGAPETEVLRRFRSFAASALRHGDAAQPALDGLRVNERRALALLEAWCAAACDSAASRDEVCTALTPLLGRFQAALRGTHAARRARGAPRTRRAVTAAIDRVADVFLAVDADSGCVVDANPAAGALLGVARDALLGVDASAFVPSDGRDAWRTELDAVTEASEPRRFRAALRDTRGSEIPVECTITRFATRERTLALVLARPAL